MKLFILSALCLVSTLAEPESDAYSNYYGGKFPLNRHNGFRQNVYSGYAVGAPYPGYPYATPTERYPYNSAFYNNHYSYNPFSGFRNSFYNRRFQRDAEPEPEADAEPGYYYYRNRHSSRFLNKFNNNFGYRKSYQNPSYYRPSTHSSPLTFHNALPQPNNYQTVPSQYPKGFSGNNFQVKETPSRNRQLDNQFFNQQRQGNPAFQRQDQAISPFFPRGNPSFPRQDQFQRQGNPQFPSQDQFQRQGNPQFPSQDQFQGQGNPFFPGQGQRNPAFPRQDQFQRQNQLQGQDQFQGQNQFQRQNQFQGQNQFQRQDQFQRQSQFQDQFQRQENPSFFGQSTRNVQQGIVSV